MSRLARHNKVLYVEPPIMDLKKRRIRQQVKTSAEQPTFYGGLARIAPELCVFKGPDWLPFLGKYPLNQLKGLVWRKLLRRALRSLKMKNPIVWLSRPTMGDMPGILDPKLIVYHVVDEYAGYGGLSDLEKALLIEQEGELLARADLTIVVSAPLLESKRDRARRVAMVANAVDYEAYRPTRQDAEVIPDDIKEIARPIIGYSGLVGRRLDLEMIARLASRRPDWSFVLVGAVRRADCDIEVSKLEALTNVHFLGLKSIEIISEYVRAFDVCMVPYRDDERANSSSPLKIYEYAAAEKPIVTSRFSAALEMAEIAMVADNETAFEAFIEKALAWSASHPRIVRGAEMARENTWDHRVREIENIVGVLLSK